MRSRDLFWPGPGLAPVVRVAEIDRSLGVGAVERVQEAGAREVRTTIVGRVGVVVDRQPFLVEEHGPVGRADPTARTVHHGDRLAPVDAAVRGAAHGYVAL